MILAGFGIIIWGVLAAAGSRRVSTTSGSNGGFFSNGWLGMVMSPQMVMFAYGGSKSSVSPPKRKIRRIHSARH